jgi:DNA polymerase-3 subunit alpha
MTFADLHVHTEYSTLDGLSTCREAVRRAAANGSTALAVTDHGGCFGHVEFQREALAAGISPVLGIEAYFRPDRLLRPAEGDKEAQKRLVNGSHLILLAQSDRGLRDLWAASTEAYVTGFYGRPRMDWAVLEEYGSDLICTTACLGGIIAGDLMDSHSDNAAMERLLLTLGRLKAIFRDRLYLELQGNDIPFQMIYNRALATVSDFMGIPLVATCDAHYPSPDDAALHKTWMACQSGKGKEDYWNFSPMLAEDALRESLLSHGLDPAVIDRAIWNTGEVASRCDARIGGHAEPPVFTPGGTADDDARHLRDLCEANWAKVEHLGREYRDQKDYEFEVVAGKGLAGCYLIVDDIIRFARSQGFLVGPGRGSDAGSLMSYLLGITSVDPLRAGLLFERFLTPGRMALPDFDLDFPTSARTPIQEYAVQRYGADHVVRVGTIMRYQAKGIVNKLASVYEDRYGSDVIADAKRIGKIVDQAEAGTAGLGLPWDEIIQDPDMAEYLDRYPELFREAGVLCNRVYAQGQHPAGLIISPGRSLAGTMPMRHAKPGDKLLVSQWDYRAAEDLNLLKLDILTLRTLDTISLAITLVRERTGISLDPRAWDIEHLDPQVYDAVGTGRTLGMFQVETPLCSDFARRLKPRTLADLAVLTTIIRPGPRNSGAAERYLARRAGREEVDYPHPLLEDMLRGSYGVMCYQEDVMRACKIVAGYDDLEADGVRKILGKKLVDKIEAAGEEFVRRSVERGHDEAVVRKMWEAMAEFGRYAFNKAHGFSYGVLSYWTAWLKEHYPAEFLTAVMSTVDAERLPGFAMEARRVGLTVLPPDVSYCQGGFTCHGITLRYGLLAIPGVGAAAVRKIVSAQPYSSYEDFLARSGADAGVLYALAKAGAMDGLVPSRKGLVRLIEADRDGSSVRCVHKVDEASGPGGLPCSLDWEQDLAGQQAAHDELMAPRIAEGRKPLKFVPKAPPSRCFRGCRRYTPPSVPGMAAWGEYTPPELFRSDLAAYGTWMSGAVFAQLDSLHEGLREQAREMARSLVTAPSGTYPAAAVLAEAHMAMTRKGTVMWWVTLLTEVSVLDLACFSPRRDTDLDVPSMLRGIRPGTLVQAEVRKRGYVSNGSYRTGWNLTAIYPLGG